MRFTQGHTWGKTWPELHYKQPFLCYMSTLLNLFSSVLQSVSLIMCLKGSLTADSFFFFIQTKSKITK